MSPVSRSPVSLISVCQFWVSLQILRAVGDLVEAYFAGLRRTVRKNLTRLTWAFLRLALSGRLGDGGLPLPSVARVLPEGDKFKSSFRGLLTTL
jgi:hypothetical protein